MSDLLRLGIVGSKFAAAFHFESYHSAGALATVAGVYSKTRENTDKFAAARGITAVSSFEEMVESVDVVDICAPGYVHEQYAIKAAQAGKHTIVEKPYTGYYGPDDAGDDWRGDTACKQTMLEAAMASVERIDAAVIAAGVTLCYAENWVYAPSIQKEVEVLTATQGQILWMTGEESHSGSHSPSYGNWREAGGGSIDR